MSGVSDDFVADVGNEGALTVSLKLPTLLEEGAQALVARARSIVISNDGDYAIAADFARDVRARREATEAERVKLKAPALEMGRLVDEHFRKPLTILAAAFAETKQIMGRYDERKRLEQEAEERRLTEERRKATLEAERRERETQDRIRAEEEARRAAQDAALAEARRKTEAAEAEATRERQAREAAEAKARGDEIAAAQAEKRAKDAEEAARVAREQAVSEREAAIEAKRKQLRAEAETRAAIGAMDEGNKAASEATAAALSVRKEPIRVEGVGRKVVWRFRNVDSGRIPKRYLKLDEEKLQSDIDRMKDIAQDTLGDWLEVYSETGLIIGKGRAS